MLRGELLFTELRDLPPSQAHCAIYARAERKVTGVRLLCGIFSAILWHRSDREPVACHPAAAQKSRCCRMRSKWLVTIPPFCRRFVASIPQNPLVVRDAM